PAALALQQRRAILSPNRNRQLKQPPQLIMFLIRHDHPLSESREVKIPGPPLPNPKAAKAGTARSNPGPAAAEFLPYFVISLNIPFFTTVRSFAWLAIHSWPH